VAAFMMVSFESKKCEGRDFVAALGGDCAELRSKFVDARTPPGPLLETNSGW
jgi:hypothetical protein